MDHVDVVVVENNEELDLLWNFFHHANVVGTAFNSIQSRGWPIVIYLYSDSGRFMGWDRKRNFDRRIERNGTWERYGVIHVPDQDKEWTFDEYMKMKKALIVSVDTDSLMSIL